MASDFGPTNPEDVMVIRELVPGVTTVSLPFTRMKRIKFGGRATIVRLQSGNLAVFSPVALTPALKTHIQSLGTTVSYMVALDFEHHMFLSSWFEAFPTAHIIGPEGLPEKRAEQNRTNKDVTILPFGTIFTKKDKATIKISEEFDREFDYEYVETHPNKEIVFNHRPSQTLIEADLIFNLPATEQYSKTPGKDATSGLATNIFTRLMNTRGSAVWQKRFLWYVMVKRGDREAFGRSMERIQGWEFRNIVPCHGDCIVGDGKGVFQRVMEWHLTKKGGA
ncbi:hypothetical protein HYFRA_00000059 [Hymenoscyphus fraxineus]|uniref:DUF4336 domain-containing protein n=1 Tax=Hymenoscyphus fraxineus TaxID=746836 RepID=A0A9N9L3Z6_9HELO|nr:hypothetical protein HYFRA_00000059 [Hymenoscyphus fraxineus]